MSQSPLVYTVTLNWNRPDDTLEFLESVAGQSYEGLRVIVADNGSTDNSVARIQASFPDVELVLSHENLGFAGGANLGLRRALEAGADFVFLANNDTLLDPEAVGKLVAGVEPGVGMSTPLIYYAGDPQRIWSAGALIHPLLLETRGDARGEMDTGQRARSEDRDFATGCGMLLSRQLLEQVGLFDEQFHMYYEDLDLCLRARRAGFRIRLVPEAKMWHKVAQSSGGSDSANERYWMARSSVSFFRKHARGAQWPAILLWRAGSALRTTLRLMLAGRYEACGAYWRGLRDGVREP